MSSGRRGLPLNGLNNITPVLITITFTQNGHSVLRIPGVPKASSASASVISESVHLCRAASIRITVPIFGLLTHDPEVNRCGNQYPEHQQGRGLVYFVVI